MTGLQHLIAFLNERNILSWDEVALLARRGLWTRTSRYANFEQPAAPAAIPDVPAPGDWLYDVEVPIRRRKRRRRRRTQGVVQSVTPGPSNSPAATPANTR